MMSQPSRWSVRNLEECSKVGRLQRLDLVQGSERGEEVAHSTSPYAVIPHMSNRRAVTLTPITVEVLEHGDAKRDFVFLQHDRLSENRVVS